MDLMLVVAQSGGGNAGAAGMVAMLFSCFTFLISIVLGVIGIIGMWKVFAKADRPGWAALVPIYNCIVLLEIIGRPVWWLALLFIPLVNIVAGAIMMIDLAKSFGRSPLFGIGLLLAGVIFFPILGFGASQYQGPAAPPPASPG